jgi:thioesterase domain-containing protein
MEANLATCYAPTSTYAGPVQFISAAEGLHHLQERLDSWRMFAPHLNDVRMPGNHMTMLSAPHAGTLGNWLGERLEVRGTGVNLLLGRMPDRVRGQ